MPGSPVSGQGRRERADAPTGDRRRLGWLLAGVGMLSVSTDSLWVRLIAAMGMCFNPLGRLANSNALRFAPVSEVALFSPTETVAGTLWAALFLSELPSVLTVAGALVVLAGVFYGTVASGRASTPRAGA